MLQIWTIYRCIFLLQLTFFLTFRGPAESQTLKGSEQSLFVVGFISITTPPNCAVEVLHLGNTDSTAPDKVQPHRLVSTWRRLVDRESCVGFMEAELADVWSYISCSGHVRPDVPAVEGRRQGRRLGQGPRVLAAKFRRAPPDAPTPATVGITSDLFVYLESLEHHAGDARCEQSKHLVS